MLNRRQCEKWMDEERKDEKEEKKNLILFWTQREFSRLDTRYCAKF